MLIGNGDGTFLLSATTQGGWGPSLVIADFNNDAGLI